MMTTETHLPRLRELARDGDAYRFVLAEADLGVLVIGSAIEDCNAAACRLFGHVREALIGRDPLELSPEMQPDGSRSATAATRRLQSALAGLPQWCEWRFREARGEPVDTFVHVEAVLIDGRRRVLLRMRDISRLQRAESRLRDTEMRLQQILDNSTNALVYAKDAGGRYLFVNRAFERLLGKPADEIVGKKTADLFAPEIAERLMRNDRRAIGERRAIEVEEQIAVGGELRTEISNKFPLLDGSGNPYGVCGISVDITARTRVEHAMRRAALAVSAVEGDGLFAALVRSLAAILSVDIAFIALPSPADATKLRMLAFCVDGRLVEDFEYTLAGTPCASVIGQQYRIYPSQLSERFPLESDLHNLGVDAYAGHPLTGAQGKALGLISVGSRRPFADPELVESMLKIFAARAVTEIERRRTDQALRDSEAQYRAIFNASADALVLRDADFRIVDVNSAYEAWTGIPRDQAIGSDRVLANPPDVNERVKAMHSRVLAGEPIVLETLLLHRDGTHRELELRGMPIRHRGAPHVLYAGRDITERKRAEEALRDSEAQYRAMFNASADALMLWNSRLQRVDVNPAHEKIFGFRREEVVGHGFEGLPYPEEFVRPRIDMVRRALAGEASRVELDALRKDGEPIVTELRTVPFVHRGEPHVLQIARDITERRRADEERAKLEAQLRQAQKMEAIGHLTGGIAHDFNNILTSILGFVVLARERDAAESDRKLAQYLDKARQASLRGRDVIQQMLTFSRGKRGEPRRVDLPSLVYDTLKLAGGTLPSSIVLDVDLEQKVAPVLADPVQVEQVLLNLLINARDAMGGTGTIEVRIGLENGAREVCASCRRPIEGRLVTLAVRDSGSGIEPELLDRIFDPFFTTKGPGKGSGMGLSVVHGIVHEYGGHIRVDSVLGKGATFRILLPAISDAHLDVANEIGARDAPDTFAPQLALMSGSVLVVDDEAMAGEFIGELLTSRGLDVTVKTDPVEAVRWFAEDPYRIDLVVSDQTMPRMTGLELAQKLTAERPELPVVLCTGYGGDIEPDDLRRYGVAALLRKPIEPAALAALVASHLARG